MLQFSRTFQLRNQSAAIAMIGRVVREVCQLIDSPRSLAVWLLYSASEAGCTESGQQLVSLGINPADYLDSQSFADDYLVTEMLSKADFIKTGYDRKARAMEAFTSYEEQCKVTNALINQRINSSERTVWMNHSVTEKLKRWLPPVDANLLGDVIDSMAWGPGVTSSAKGSHLSRYNKMSSRLDVTSDLLLCGAHHLVNAYPHWASGQAGAAEGCFASVLPSCFSVLKGNTVTTVPKNAKTDRTIAVEPHVNAAFQRGIGVVLRSFLLKLGVDLTDQTRNQKLARKGSVDGFLATVDLKGASDTIARELVREILPPDWFSLLDSARSKFYESEGQFEFYQKFSSMGNGFTFELESMIFYACALSACEYLNVSTTEVSVYGDDIIIPAAAVPLFMELIYAYGFTSNQKKTFTSGFFRESCGADFFYGINVRPFFIRSVPRDIESVYELGNAIRRYSAMRLNGMGSDARFKHIFDYVVSCVPNHLRYRVPVGVTGGFISEFDEACPDVSGGNYFRKWCKSQQKLIWRGRRVIFKPVKREKRHHSYAVGSTLWARMSLECKSSVDFLRFDDLWQKVVKRGVMRQPVLNNEMDILYSLRDSGQLLSVQSSYDDWEGPGAWL